MIFRIETGEENATLVAVLRLLAGRGVKPTRVASKPAADAQRMVHRIETHSAEGATGECENLVEAIARLEGVVSVKTETTEDYAKPVS